MIAGALAVLAVYLLAMFCRSLSTGILADREYPRVPPRP